MTVPEVICKTVAMQNNDSQWPCSMCPIPRLRLVGVRTSYIFLIFPGHPEFWTPLQIPIGGPLAAPCYTSTSAWCIWDSPHIPLLHLYRCSSLPRPRGPGRPPASCSTPKPQPPAGEKEPLPRGPAKPQHLGFTLFFLTLFFFNF